MSTPERPSVPVPPGGDLAIKRSVVRCLLCWAASFGVYGFYWFHQYRRRISAELGRTDDAGLHTAGLLVPFLNFYLVYLLWRDIGEARVRVGLSDVPAGAYLAASILIAPVIYGIMATRLNEYWDRRTGGAATDAPFSRGEATATFLPLAVFLGFLLLLVALLAGGS
jgi:hypothetical protein